MYIDHTSDLSITKNTTRVTSALKGLRDNLRLGAALYNRVSPSSGDAVSLSTESDDGQLDVRLVSNRMGELWFATGDVQYDMTHGAACAAITISSDDTDDDIATMASQLVDDIVNQLYEQATDD
jgi:hypothetical protein